MSITGHVEKLHKFLYDDIITSMNTDHYGSSNARYRELSYKEIMAQEQVLEPLREKHTAELMDSGAAMRIRLAAIALNESSYKNEASFTEGTTLYACRYSIENVNRRGRVDVGVGLGRLATTFSFGDDPNVLTAAGDRPFAYVAGIGRLDSTREYPYRNRYVPAGILAMVDTAQGPSIEPFIPAKGVEMSDLDLLVRQMEETWDFAEEKHLTIIDPCTAEDGPGERGPIITPNLE